MNSSAGVGRDLLTLIADGATTTWETGFSPYYDGVRPSEPLSAFDGENSQGAWRLEISGAGTGGVGLWSWALQVNGRELDVDPLASAAAALRLSGPNPVRGSGAFALELPEAAEVDLALLDGWRAAQDREKLRRALGVKPGEQLVCNIGTVSDRKGQHTFARAVDLLWRRHPELAARTRFILLGGRDTPFDTMLADALRELGRPNLIVILTPGHEARRRGISLGSSVVGRRLATCLTVTPGAPPRRPPQPHLRRPSMPRPPLNVRPEGGSGVLAVLAPGVSPTHHTLLPLSRARGRG